MATFFIGDIQGCFDELILLLKKIKFNHQQDTLYLTGDLIGRGPKALATLEYVIKHQHSIKTVLGHHDLHFLAITCGIKKAKSSDKFEQLLASPRLTDFIDYLRQQPLLIELTQPKIILCHAGVNPQWDLATAKKAAQAVSKQLKQDNYAQLLGQMYDNSVVNWADCQTALQQSIFTINACTRMRYCYHDGNMDYQQNCPPAQLNDPRLTPWFKLENDTLKQGYRIIFGHWASLVGRTDQPNTIALDTGCLWGNHLTAWQLENQQFSVQNAL